MKKLAMLGLVFLAAGNALYGQKVTKAGTTAASFLKVDMGARTAGMGSAGVAAVMDATAAFWNPAGLARLAGAEALFSHNRWLADIAFDFAGVAVPVRGLGTLAVHATFLTMDEMERTTILEPDGTGETFTAGGAAFGLSFARNLTDRFSIGFSVKAVEERIFHSSARSAAFDIGTLFDTPLKGVRIGMSITNYGSKMRMSGDDLLLQTDIDPTIAGNNQNLNANLQTDAYDLPLLFRVGVSVDVLKDSGWGDLMFSLDALHPNDDVESLNAGVEYTFGRRVALRAGYKSLFARDSEEGLSLGAGFRQRVAGSVHLRLDYAFKDFGILDSVQMFSIGLGF
jgi:hypothetical protein